MANRRRPGGLREARRARDGGSGGCKPGGDEDPQRGTGRREGDRGSRSARGGVVAGKSAELSEQRLRQLVDGLRDLAGRLEDMLHEVPAASGADGEPPREHESMEESLRPSAAVQAASPREP